MAGGYRGGDDGYGSTKDNKLNAIPSDRKRMHANGMILPLFVLRESSHHNGVGTFNRVHFIATNTKGR